MSKMDSRSSVRSRDKLRPLQLYLADIIEGLPAAMLAVDMSLGKTGAVLTAIRKLLDQFVITKVLVVAPKRVATDTWPDEIGAWTHTKALTYSVLVGSPVDRSKAARENTEIHIINRENLVWLVNFWGEAWPYDMLVWDESSRLKAGKKRVKVKKAKPSTAVKDGREISFEEMQKAFADLLDVEGPQRLARRAAIIRYLKSIGAAKLSEVPKKMRAAAFDFARDTLAKFEAKKPPLSEFGSICKVRRYFDKVVELSGTPAPNGLIDLWGPTYLLDGGQRLGANITAFKNRWFDSDYMGWKIEPKENAFDEIMGKLSDVMFGMRAEDYIDLPEVIPNPIYVTMPPTMLKEYRRFERTLVSELYDVEAVSRGVLTNKLLQYANGGLYRKDESVVPARNSVVPVHELKLDALGSVIAEAAGNPVLTAYSFRFDLDRLVKRFPKAVLFENEPDFVKLWNAGKITHGIAHPASIGHGLNLQFGGHIACWYGLTWSLELYLQFNMRLPRPGQRSPFVVIHHIVTKGTADEDVLRVLGRRGATQDAVTDAVRIRLLGQSEENAQWVGNSAWDDLVG